MTTATEQLLLRLDATSESLRRELRRADNSVAAFDRKTSRHMRSVDQAMGRVDRAAGRVTKGLVGMAAALSVGALSSFTRSTIEAADAMAKTASRLGLTAESLQELRFGAARSGIEVAALENSLQRFTRGLGEAQAGTGSFLPVLRQAGIALRDASGQARNSEAVLDDFADAVQNAGSAQERLRLTFAAFGREGGPLVNLLKEGSVGLDEFRRQARETGVVLSNDLADRAQDLNDTLGEIGERIQTANTELLLSLDPIIRSTIALYEDLTAAATNFLSLFVSSEDMGLSQLEDRLERLTGYLAFIQRNPTHFDFGNLSRTRDQIAEVEALIAEIRGEGVELNSGPPPLNDLFSESQVQAVTDNLAEMQSQVYAAAGALETLGMSGRDAMAEFEARVDLVRKAETLAESFNRTNRKAIDSGVLLARTGEAYLPTLQELADLDERRAAALQLGDYIDDLHEEQRFARDRLRLGEEEAEINRQINRLKVEGIALDETTEARIRGTVAETRRLEEAWQAQTEAQREAARAAEKAAADAAASLDRFPEEHADAFGALVMEALQ